MTRPQIPREELICRELCLRPRSYCAEVAPVERRTYRDEVCWGRPVPSVGDGGPNWIVGRTPVAHGANWPAECLRATGPAIFYYWCCSKTGFAS